MSTDGGGWTRIVNDDYETDDCPSNSYELSPWSHVSSANVCYPGAEYQASATFETLGVSYTEIRGTMSMRVYYSMDAFNQPERRSGIETPYVDGVSVTTGGPESRSHVFTYAVRMVPNYPSCGSAPAFVGSNYLCGSVTREPGIFWFSPTLFGSDTFQVSADGTSPIEVRMMSNERWTNEAVGISTIELYVR